MAGLETLWASPVTRGLVFAATAFGVISVLMLAFYLVYGAIARRNPLRLWSEIRSLAPMLVTSLAIGAFGAFASGGTAIYTLVQDDDAGATASEAVDAPDVEEAVDEGAAEPDPPNELRLLQNAVDALESTDHDAWAQIQSFANNETIPFNQRVARALSIVTPIALARIPRASDEVFVESIAINAAVMEDFADRAPANCVAMYWGSPVPQPEVGSSPDVRRRVLTQLEALLRDPQSTDALVLTAEQSGGVEDRIHQRLGHTDETRERYFASPELEPALYPEACAHYVAYIREVIDAGALGVVFIRSSMIQREQAGAVEAGDDAPVEDAASEDPPEE